MTEDRPHGMVIGVGAGTGLACARRFAAGNRPDEVFHIAHQPRSTRSFLVELRPFGKKW